MIRGSRRSRSKCRIRHTGWRPSSEALCLLAARGAGMAISRALARFRMDRPRYIAVEGPVGVGKSALAQALAERTGARLVQEDPEENPFLRASYQDRKKHAFQA